MNRGPCVVHVTNPLAPHRRTTFVGADGAALGSLAPRAAVPVLCLVNGEYVLPEDWDLPVSSLDHVVFVTMPQGGGNSNPLMVLLSIVVIAVGVFTSNPYLIAAGAGLLVAGVIMPQAFLPNTGQEKSPSPTYNIALTGNIARLGQPMPIQYGRHILTPDFAAQPYSEYKNNDQYYFALFCIGVMEKFTLEQIMIDDTAIDHFVDVEVQIVGPQYPGVSLTLVDPCVVTAPEVVNQDLLKDKPVGPFTVCGPGLHARTIGIDVVCPKGLYMANDAGVLGSKSLSWAVEVRKMKDDGTVDGPWVYLGSESLTDHTNTPLRRTYYYAVEARRYEVRVTRTDERDENVRAGHDLQWIGLRAYLTEAAPLDPNAVFVAIKMKASNQLSGLTQRKFTVVQRRWLKTWDPIGGWSDYVDTSSIAWAMVDVLKNTAYGGAIGDDRVDLQTFYELDQIWAKRGDTFNGVFDKRITVWQALRAIAQAGRAAPLMRGSVFTCVRDQKISLPTAAFGMTNIARGSFSVEYTVFTENDADGLELEYFDERTWSNRYVSIPYPGLSETVMPAKATIMGITGLDQATREAQHMLNDAFARRAHVTFQTELEGYLPSYGDTIVVSHDIASWGVSGDLEVWDSPFARTTERVGVGIGPHYAVLTDEFGDLHGPYLIQAGADDQSIEFLELPDFEPYAGVERLRTRFTLGPATNFGKVCKVLSIQPGDEERVRIVAVTDDTMVYDEDDEGNLVDGRPGGGSDRVARYMDDGVPTYDSATDDQHNGGGFFSDDGGKVGAALDDGYAYADDDET